MTKEELVNGIDALRIDALGERMDAVTVRKKLFKAFDYAEKLAMEIKELEIRKLSITNTMLRRRIIYNCERANDDLLFFCAITLQAWYNDVQAQKYRRMFNWKN